MVLLLGHNRYQLGWGKKWAWLTSSKERWSKLYLLRLFLLSFSEKKYMKLTPFAPLLTRSLALITCLLALHCLLCSRAPLRSLICSLACSLCSLPSSWESECLDGYFFWVFFLFWPIVGFSPPLLPLSLPTHPPFPLFLIKDTLTELIIKGTVVPENADQH